MNRAIRNTKEILYFKDEDNIYVKNYYIKRSLIYI